MAGQSARNRQKREAATAPGTGMFASGHKQGNVSGAPAEGALVYATRLAGGKDEDVAAISAAVEGSPACLVLAEEKVRAILRQGGLAAIGTVDVGTVRPPPAYHAPAVTGRLAARRR